MKMKLTIRSVEAVQAADRDVVIWDTEVPGFGLKVTPAGRRAYFLYYRTQDGQQRRPSIGTHGSVKPQAARAIARSWRAAVVMGFDPSQSRLEQRAASTVGELCERYLSEHADRKKKASSVRNDRRLINAHIKPAIGIKKVTAVTRSDVASLHHALRETPYEANRLLALASKMFKLAERWGLRPDGSNPATNIDRYPELKRERYLSPTEIARLWAVLNSEAAKKVASPQAIAAVKLLVLTGRRLTEVLGLQWDWLDLQSKLLRLPDTKNGALVVSLNEAALALLLQLRSAPNVGKFVIPGQRKGRPLVNLQKPWRALRKLADLEDVRLHDLRHTFASIGAGLGMSLSLLGRLLGHTQASTTARYAHLAQNPVRDAADAIGAELMRMSDIALDDRTASRGADRH